MAADTGSHPFCGGSLLSLPLEPLRRLPSSCPSNPRGGCLLSLPRLHWVARAQHSQYMNEWAERKVDRKVLFLSYTKELTKCFFA
jgi:hypothetical protein